MGDLRKRVGVAVVGIPMVLGLVYLGGWFVAVPLAAFAGWATHELYRFARERDVRPIEWIGISGASALVLLAGWRPDFAGFAPYALGIVTAVALVAALEAMRTRGPEGTPLASASITLFGTIYAGLSLAFAPMLLSLPSTRGWSAGADDQLSGLLIVALPLVATWVGDASAYFAGSAWGRDRAKLAPRISPNKSWVGFWADLAGGAVAALLWYVVAGPRLPGLEFVGFPLMALVGAVLGFAAVIGDLLESLLKREAGVKDSGTFFPGHGGVLDRIDSLIFTIPSAYALLLLLSLLS